MFLVVCHVFLEFGHRGAYKLQIDVFNRILALSVEFSDGLSDIVGIGVFLAIELIPSEPHGVFGKVPSIGKVDRLYNTVDDGQRMGGVPCPQDIHLPVFPGHLIEVLSLDLAHLEADDAVRRAGDECLMGLCHGVCWICRGDGWFEVKYVSRRFLDTF